ncbi:hypothetical protein [Actinoplanes sp. CA-252034]|uniref:hypothetical protein n=1 Tax=Actinoplanes sp. CA-252034 TaxID=3239906 RepID=UPI003D993CA1
MVVIFIALLLLALTAFAVKQLLSVDADPTGGSDSGLPAVSAGAVGADGTPDSGESKAGGDAESTAGGGVMVPGTSESDPARLAYTLPPLGPIQGVDGQAVARAWEKRWKAPLKENAELRERYTIVDYPAGGGRLSLVLTTIVGGAEAESVRCLLEHGTKKVDRKVLDGVVNDCLAPALEQSERAEVITWLSAQDYKAATNMQTWKKSMPRFDLTVDVLAGSLRASVVGRP